jgi:anti-sigma factor RsiW
MTDSWNGHETERLSEYLDGELALDEREGVEAHLAGCAACRDILDELRGVTRLAQRLDDRPSDRDLWPGIAERLEPRRSTSIWRRRLTFTVPQAVAAGLVLAIVSGGAVWLSRLDRTAPAGAGPGPEAPAPVVRVNLADQSYDHAIDDLEAVLADGRDRLDPRTYAVIERNLRAIDRAIAEARQALAADPGNVYLNNHLATARQRKLSLLRRATALARTEG